MIEASPPMSAMLARLSPDPPSSSPDQLHAGSNSRARLAHQFDCGVLGLGCVGSCQRRCFRSSLPGIVFAAVVGSVLMLRARTHQDIARAVPPVICGAVTLSAALIACAVRVSTSRAAHRRAGDGAWVPRAVRRIRWRCGDGLSDRATKSRTSGIFRFRDRRTADLLALRSVRRGAQRESVVTSARLAVCAVRDGGSSSRVAAVSSHRRHGLCRRRR